MNSPVLTRPITNSNAFKLKMQWRSGYLLAFCYLKTDHLNTLEQSRRDYYNLNGQNKMAAKKLKPFENRTAQLVYLYTTAFGK
jgi:hypothetical protein